MKRQVRLRPPHGHRPFGHRRRSSVPFLTAALLASVLVTSTRAAQRAPGGDDAGSVTGTEAAAWAIVQALERQAEVAERQLAQQEAFLLFQRLQLVTVEQVEARRRLAEASAEARHAEEEVDELTAEVRKLSDRIADARSGVLSDIEASLAQQLAPELEHFEALVERKRDRLASRRLAVAEARQDVDALDERAGALEDRIEALLRDARRARAAREAPAD